MMAQRYHAIYLVNAKIQTRHIVPIVEGDVWATRYNKAICGKEPNADSRPSWEWWGQLSPSCATCNKCKKIYRRRIERMWKQSSKLVAKALKERWSA